VGKKSKTKGKGHKPSKKYAKYTVEGKSVKRARFCPRCGPGVFLGNHKNRLVCGNCGYVEIK
jgi:small subunit ribosomal protein S27Ae